MEHCKRCGQPRIKNSKRILKIRRKSSRLYSIATYITTVQGLHLIRRRGRTLYKFLVVELESYHNSNVHVPITASWTELEISPH